jgi:acyl dehydratase
MKIIKKDEVASAVGFESAPSEWFEVKQEQINQFADCTLDHQFIHIDPVKAKETPFGSTIAHGFLTLSMLSYFAESFSVVIEGVFMGVNYGFDKVRFLAPVKVDSKVRAVGKVVSIDEKNPGQFLIKYDVTIEIEGEDKPALKAEWLAMQMVG